MAGARLANSLAMLATSDRVGKLLTLGLHLGDELGDGHAGQKATMRFEKLPVEPLNRRGRRRLLGRRVSSLAGVEGDDREGGRRCREGLSLIHISEPTR